MLAIPAPQPFHAGPEIELRNSAPEPAQKADAGMIAGAAGSVLPEIYSASARRCARLRSAAWAFIDPFSSVCRICPGAIRPSASRPGAGELLPASWQIAQ